MPIPPIVYVTGLERSGTTLLHNLLALHRDARVLRRWELLEPVPPPETATYDTDARIERVQTQTDVLRGTLLEHMHWVNATDPEECVCGFIDSLAMVAWAASPCLPTWGRFLAEEDLGPAFENYRRVVQLLLWKHPVEPGGFLVLKAPQIGRQLAVRRGLPRGAVRDHRSRPLPLHRVVGRAGSRHRRAVLRGQPADRRRAPFEDQQPPGARQAGEHRRLHDR